VLETNFHSVIVDCVECGSYVVSADVLKKKEFWGKIVVVQVTRLWLVRQRRGHHHRPVITADTVRWEITQSTVAGSPQNFSVRETIL
jgi:hypothetical protein